MEAPFLIALVALVAAVAVLLLLTWGAYTGRTRLLWIRGVRPLIGGRYWFVLSPTVLVGSVLGGIAGVLVEANPETSGLFSHSPSDPLPASIILWTAACLILALVVSYWLPDRLKPQWIREVESLEAGAEATRAQARPRG